MSKKFDLGSFILHPQLKATYSNKESEKLMNHDSDGTSGSNIATQGTTNINTSAASQIMSSGGFKH